ncbi:MAG: pilus assembly protein [Chloroflexota bacterium]|nr:pilus assembly protein [Chloroflexota bacterium]
MTSPRYRSRTCGQRQGQALVEFALILPVFLVILFGALEFGSAYDHRTALAYAVREGARVGASLGKGGSNPSAVDPAIVAAVQRGLTDPILVENVSSIEIYKADSAGKAVPGKVDTYDRNGTLVGTAGWPASTRVPGLGGDSIGVLVRYDFHPTTPLGYLLGLVFGGSPPYTTIPMTDATVMRLEPIP